MRILAITSLFPRRPEPNLGVFILRRLKALAACGAEVRVLSPVPWVPRGPVPLRYAALRDTPPEDIVEGLPVAYPRYLMVPKIGVRWQAAGYASGLLPALREEAESFRPDIVDAHYLYPDACGVGRAAGALGLPYACTARGSDVHVLAREPAIARQVHRALAGAAAVLAVSRDLRRAMREQGLWDGPVAVVPNGVDTDLFRPRAQAEARRSLDLPSGGLVVCVGNLVALRGHDLLLRALARPEAPPDLSVALVGDGPERGALEALARGLGLEGRVRFPGAVPSAQVPLWLAASDGSVQLSHSAGSPNAVLESVAAGRPVLASDIPPMREALRVPECGLLVSPEEEAVARGLATLLRIGSVDPVGVRTWHDVARETLAFFESTLAGETAPV